MLHLARKGFFTLSLALVIGLNPRFATANPQQNLPFSPVFNQGYDWLAENTLSEPLMSKAVECRDVGQNNESKKELTKSDSEKLFSGEIIVIGNSILHKEIQEEIDRFLTLFPKTPSGERKITQKELENLLLPKITQLYLDRGYLTSKAQSVTITDEGNAEIYVVEGRLARINLIGRQRLNRGYICDRILLGVETPLNTTRLEEQLRLLSLNPLFKSVKADLQALETTEIGESQLTVTVQEANPLIFNLSFDNYSPPSIGAERYGIEFGYRNLSGLGDEIFGSYYLTTSGGADVFDFIYRIPLNARDGTLQIRTSPYWQKITQSPFDEFGIEAQREFYEISYRQPIINRLREEFALSVGFSFQRGQTFAFDLPTPFGIGPDENGVSRISVLQFGQDYINRDLTGLWALRSQLNIGVGLFGVTTNDPPIPDGYFFSWVGQFQRVQRFGNDHLTIIQADVQLTPDSLLPAYQFIIGGGQSVRGYRQNARSGDNGFRFSIEDRITLVRNREGESLFQIAPFLDMGYVWNQGDNPNKLPNQRFLLGSGLGFIWQPLDSFIIRLDYGYPFIDLDDRGNNIQDDGLYFQVNYQF